MFLVGERPDYIDPLLERLKKISDHLMAQAPTPIESLSLPEVADLYSSYNSDSLFVVRSGAIQASKNGRPFMVYEEGDVLGLSNGYDLPSPEFSTDEFVALDRYDTTELLKHLTSTRENVSAWTAYILSLNSLYMDCYGRMVRLQKPTHTGFLEFEAGDVIITEGDDATEVYTIIQGSAEVSVGGVKVGEIKQDEIFGAMAVFTHAKRSATVTALQPCSVLAVPKDDFVTLMQSHPETTMTLIENMAKSIINLNAQLVDQSENK